MLCIFINLLIGASFGYGTLGFYFNCHTHFHSTLRKFCIGLSVISANLRLFMADVITFLVFIKWL